MLLLERGNWWKQIGTLRGTALVRVWPRLCVVTVVATGVTIVHEYVEHPIWGLTTIPFSLVAVALGIFLGFRNNTSYDRFWEGRKLWGRLVNTTRSLARQVQMMVGPQREALGIGPEQAAVHRELVYRVIAYVHALRLHLRDEDRLEELEGLLPDEERQALRGQLNRPLAILRELGGRFRDLWQQGDVHPMHLPVLEESLTALTDIQGACERIKSTPIPSSYTVLIHRIVALYTFALPFGIVETVNAATPVVVAIIAYAFFGLDAVGEEIEEPFGTDINDLPLSTLSRMIEINLRQTLGETEVPDVLRPVDGVLQ
ncbi:bestrophin family protein [Paraliomyxa miuraensis]|uniref:bestrophin family protein n=1 Tax=Paraliomyxa miuraensis TaxID=376150 RepID=UPI0022593435|nr:bestrophin family ion channel [Paraliomyxa miuraensis]MCX4243300.1 bestrophin [Paraliomyxa miuraensis]